MPFFALAAAVAGPLIGSAISGNAAQSAANTQAQAANEAAQIQLQEFQQLQQQLAPYSGAGVNSLANLLEGVGVNPTMPTSPGTGTATGGIPGLDLSSLGIPGLSGRNSLASFLQGGQPTASGGGQGFQYGPLNAPFDWSQIAKNPAYQFILGQGEEAITDKASAGGGVGGGNTLKALLNYGQGAAAQFGDQLFNEDMATKQNAFNQLFNLTSLGESAAAGVGNAGLSTASNIGDLLTSSAAAKAAGQVGSANSLASALSGGGSNFLTYLLANGGNLFGGGGGSSAFGPGDNPPPF